MGASTGVCDQFPFASRRFDWWSQHHRNDRFVRREEQVAPTIAAHLNVGLMSQVGQRADGNANMTLRAYAIAHDGDTLFAVREQPVVMRQNGRGDGLPDRFHDSFPVALIRSGLQLDCLKGKKIFHDILHIGIVIIRSPPVNPLFLRRKEQLIASDAGNQTCSSSIRPDDNDED
jgi:hypothetical protein